jgi:hypothetical protein
VIFVRVERVMFWCGNMTRMGLSGYFASNATGGISITLDVARVCDNYGRPICSQTIENKRLRIF